MLEKKKKTKQHTDTPICIKKKAFITANEDTSIIDRKINSLISKKKKKKEEKSEDVIGALFKDFKTTIYLLIKGECIYHFTGSYVKPQSVLFMYFQMWPHSNI